MNLVSIIVYFSLCAFSAEVCSASLELVHVFFRHGSRTPDRHEVYPNDPHAANHFSPVGYGQLTNNGKKRAYQLGKLLRKRYDKFLGEIYTPDLVWLKSTDFDRTQMSALLVLAALFPPPPSQKWDENLNWMPIPYHYEKTAYDYELRRPNAYCPAYLKELQKVLASDDVKQILKDHAKTFQYISRHTGKQITKLIDMFSIFQILHSEENMNLTLPKWTKTVYPDLVHYLASKQCYFENSNDILKRLNGGRMLKKVIENMIAKSNGSTQTPGRKMYLYSGHDNNVINILSTLNLYELHFPNYSAAVIIELHNANSTNEYSVKVLYARDVYTEPEEQSIPGCGTSCPLEQFLEITRRYLPTNFTEECESAVLLD